jgi:enoyl-CoA hydratase/carnithine racemase
MSAGNAGTVTVRREDEVSVVTLQREHKCNALSAHMETELLRALRSPEVASSRAVVVTGGDTVFSAGADVTEMRAMTTQSIVDYYRGSGSVYEVFATLPQPTIAAITGYCLGGGLELALAADIRIADPAAVFGFPEIGIGILPSSGGVTRIGRAVGVGRARDLVLRGRRFDADQAQRWGVITEVSSPGEHLLRSRSRSGTSSRSIRRWRCASPSVYSTWVSTHPGKRRCCSKSWPMPSSTMRPATRRRCPRNDAANEMGSVMDDSVAQHHHRVASVQSGSDRGPQKVVGVLDHVAVPLLGEEPLPVRGVLGVQAVTGHHRVEDGAAAVGLGTEQPSQPLGLLLA